MSTSTTYAVVLRNGKRSDGSTYNIVRTLEGDESFLNGSPLPIGNVYAALSFPGKGTWVKDGAVKTRANTCLLGPQFTF